MQRKNDTEVISMNMDDGSVRSIDITYKGFPETVHARCFVASSGGFQANLDWMRQYWGDAVDNFAVAPGQNGYIGAGASLSIRGGDYDQIGYELDGIPVNRAFDSYPLTDQEVERAQDRLLGLVQT